MNPIDTVTGLPSGVGCLFDRVGTGAGRLWASATDSSKSGLERTGREEALPTRHAVEVGRLQLDAAPQGFHGAADHRAAEVSENQGFFAGLVNSVSDTTENERELAIARDVQNRMSEDLVARLVSGVRRRNPIGGRSAVHAHRCST